MDNYSVLFGKKLAGGGGSATLIDKDITANGTYNARSDNADGYKKVVVGVPNTYTSADEGKVVDSGALEAQTSKSIDANGTYNTTLNNEVVVTVPNSYTQSDEGKVVSQGTLVAQTAYPSTVTQNGTIDTTLNNSVTVDVEAQTSVLKSYIEGSLDTVPSEIAADVGYKRPYWFGNNFLRSVTVNKTPTTTGTLSYYSCSDVTLTVSAGSFAGSTSGLASGRFCRLHVRDNGNFGGVNALSGVPLCHLVLDKSVSGGTAGSGDSVYSCFNSSPLATVTISAKGVRDALFANAARLLKASCDVVTVGSYSFSKCVALHDVTFSNRLTTISSNAFYKCYALKNIVLPSSVTTINSTAFRECVNLTTITIDKPQDSVSGAPWGATNATVVWTG